MTNAAPVMSLENTFMDFRSSIPAVVQTMACGAMAIDSNCIVVYANQWLFGRLGLGRRDMIGQSISTMFDEKVVERLRASLDGQPLPRPFQTTAIRCDGAPVPVLAVPQTLRDRSGNVTGTFLFLLDAGDVEQATQAPTAGWQRELDRTARRVARRDAAVSGLPDAPADSNDADVQSLSMREWDVAKRLVAGLRAPAIARELDISVHTVRNHLKSCYRKLGVHSQSDLIDYMLRLMAS